MLTSPANVFARANELKESRQSFVLATVIAVRGSTSAKVGAKAIFNPEGRNLLGWVGGGCCESFVARHCVEALKEKTPRIVTADLDDEVFGLMPCGGTMDVYLEPHFSAVTLNAPALGDWQEPIASFVRELGFELAVKPSDDPVRVTDWKSAWLAIAQAFAETFDRPLHPLRSSKGGLDLPLPRLSADLSTIVILGQSRITEHLCRMAKRLGWAAQVYAPNPDGERFPTGTAVCELPVAFQSMTLPAHVPVIVASHHQQDHEFVAHALACGSPYVGLVASERRSRLILEELYNRNFEVERLKHYFAPAGLSLRSETPSLIAFSILSEILSCQGRLEWI